ncbi:MAG: hypothetical protein H6828_06395 [Planctomycetes bacterium]|nr:hypothetical protein [Planctomycetota bacterium]
MIPALSAALVLGLCAPAQETAAPELPVLDNATLSQALAELDASAQAELDTLGASRDGRPVHVLTIHGAPRAEGEARPAILVAAGLDGPHAYTSSLALEHARRLVQGYGRDDAVTRFLDATTVYVLPRLDVDGAAARFARPLDEVLATGYGVDDDRDGRQGEDPRADVDGDGLVTWMRVRDAEGEWIADPVDPRAMRKADRAKGELGEYALYREGYDADGDERVAEDGPRNAQVDRNFPRAWAEHADDAGRYPTDEPAVLGAVEFVLAHDDLVLALCYGEQGNLVGKPATQPDGGPRQRGALELGLHERDAAVVKELGARYREATKNTVEGVGEQPGSFASWLYHHRGLWTLDVAPWAVPLDFTPPAAEDAAAEERAAPDAAAPATAERGKAKAKADEGPEASDDAKRLRWLDHEGRDAFAPWTPFEHPQLGAVEVGGFKPYALVEPTPTKLAELADAHQAWLLTLGELLPRPRLELERFDALGGGLYELRVALVNDALLPFPSHAATRAGTVAPLQVRLELPAGATLVAGEARELVETLDAAGGRRALRWLVTLPAGADAPRVRLVSRNAGGAVLTATQDQAAQEVR